MSTVPADLQPQLTAKAATVDAPTEPKRYDRQIAFLNDLLANKRTERLHAHTTEQASQCDTAIAQFQEAIDIYTDANEIEPVLTQFGSHASAGWNCTIPPNFGEFRGNPARRIQADFYRVQTDDPLKIAYLRRLVKTNNLEGLHEMQPGLMPVFSEVGGFAGWQDPKVYAQLKDAGALRNW